MYLIFLVFSIRVDVKYYALEIRTGLQGVKSFTIPTVILLDRWYSLISSVLSEVYRMIDVCRRQYISLYTKAYKCVKLLHICVKNILKILFFHPIKYGEEYPKSFHRKNTCIIPLYGLSRRHSTCISFLSPQAVSSISQH